MKKEDIKTAAMGGVAGAVALLIVIFATGWVVTSSSAQEMAEQMTEQAVVANLAPICVAQFSQSPDGKAGLAQLKALDSWKRSEFVETSGWATMPGSKKPANDVAGECANRLMQLAS